MCASAWGYVHMSTARRVQQKHQIPLKPEVQAAVGLLMWCWESSSGLPQEQLALFNNRAVSSASPPPGCLVIDVG